MQQMFNHGIITLGLFYCAALIINKTGETKISSLGRIKGTASSLCQLFHLDHNGFYRPALNQWLSGEFSLLNALFQYQPLLAAIAGLSTILGAVYMLRAYHHMMHGMSKYNVHDIHQNNKALLAVGSL
ncbi:MAG: hypothetical protein IPJ54_00045 [Saprospiraceae bacterium]|nr:hypothetical protein [Saprospiraceae bacterium]